MNHLTTHGVSNKLNTSALFPSHGPLFSNVHLRKRPSSRQQDASGGNPCAERSCVRVAAHAASEGRFLNAGRPHPTLCEDAFASHPQGLRGDLLVDTRWPNL